jgi:hypothetical protein
VPAQHVADDVADDVACAHRHSRLQAECRQPGTQLATETRILVVLNVLRADGFDTVIHHAYARAQPQLFRRVPHDRGIEDDAERHQHRLIAPEKEERGTDGPRAGQEPFAANWYQFFFCDDGVSMLRTSMHGVRMFTEPVFCRGRHGQESEESKKDREGSHQDGGKEDLKEKEVVVSTTEKLPPRDRHPDAKRNLSRI